MKKKLFRATLSIVIVLAYRFKLPNNYYDLITGLLILSLLIFDLNVNSYPNDFKNALSYYLSWLVICVSIFPFQGINFSIFSPISLLLFIKLFTLIVYFIKYKSFCVTKTLLSNIWLGILALYFIELCINSTHGFASLCYNFSIFSSIELIIIAFIKKNRLVYTSSIFNFLWLKK